jgi:hypothetical protein
MTRTDMLLTILAEECAEVAQRVSKALRFGLTEIQPGQDKTNAERIEQEFLDLLAVYSMLHDDKTLFGRGAVIVMPTDIIRAKTAKVEKYLAYSAECGRLQ